MSWGKTEVCGGWWLSGCSSCRALAEQARGPGYLVTFLKSPYL